MKPHILQYFRCPECLAPLRLDTNAINIVERDSAARLVPCSGLCSSSGHGQHHHGCMECTQIEVMSGTLACTSCSNRYPIDHGIPKLLIRDSSADDVVKARTARSFGYLWGRVGPIAHVTSRPYHFEKMSSALSLPTLTGFVLDAGCGEGIDLANQARDPGVEVVGVELSDGGCHTSFARVEQLVGAHVVQADLCRLPFDEATFDAIYSYGVLHHVPTPFRATAEVARVGKGGAQVAVYVYEDFSERFVGWRWLLHAVNSIRGLTTKLPPRLLFWFCRLASPLIYFLFTVPYIVFSRVPGLRAVALSFPFRHARGPFSLAGDLYDRFSAPVEYRYSRTSAMALLRQAKLSVTGVAYDRGWMVRATRDEPARSANG